MATENRVDEAISLARSRMVWRLWDDRVRLHRDGKIEHWDTNLCCYRHGWGPYATAPRIGEADRVLTEWEAARACSTAHTARMDVAAARRQLATPEDGKR